MIKVRNRVTQDYSCICIVTKQHVSRHPNLDLIAGKCQSYHCKNMLFCSTA